MYIYFVCLCIFLVFNFTYIYEDTGTSESVLNQYLICLALLLLCFVVRYYFCIAVPKPNNKY